jgi:hypothetical protein
LGGGRIKLLVNNLIDMEKYKETLEDHDSSEGVEDSDSSKEKMQESIKKQGEKLIEDILDNKRLKVEEYDILISFAGTLDLSTDTIDKIVDIGHQHFKYLRSAVKAIKLGASSDRVENILRSAIESRFINTVVSLDDIVYLSKLGVSEELNEEAISFIRPRVESYGYAAVANAVIELMKGVSIGSVDKYTRDEAEGNDDLGYAIKIAGSGASQLMRENLVKESINRKQKNNAISAARIAGRELTEQEMSELEK